MKKSTRTVLTVLLALLFMVCIGRLAAGQLDARKNQQAIDSAVALASQPAETTIPHRQPVTEPTQPVTEPPEPAQTLPPQWVPRSVEDDLIMLSLRGVNLEALQQVNPDVVGWISIPQTRIHHPITQGQDNDYYLSHTWEGESNSEGTIFLETQNAPDMTDFNTILYGHYMRNGGMFADLHLFADPDFAAEHPYVYLVTEEGIWRYEIFASYEAPVDSITYGMQIQTQKAREKFLGHALNLTQIQTGITPEVNDRFLTLSTCTGNGFESRRVVQARLPMVLE